MREQKPATSPLVTFAHERAQRSEFLSLDEGEEFQSSYSEFRKEVRHTVLCHSENRLLRSSFWDADHMFALPALQGLSFYVHQRRKSGGVA